MPFTVVEIDAGEVVDNEVLVVDVGYSDVSQASELEWKAEKMQLGGLIFDYSD